MTAAVLPLHPRDGAAGRISSHLDGTVPLTGLHLYYELELATPLMQLHGMPRTGPQNLTSGGLQQSYGDHNRLLLLGLDKLIEGDVDWYRTRLAPGAQVSDDTLAGVMAAVAALGLDRRTQVALWLGAALHDSGMLCGRGAHVDVEDGVVVSAEVLEALCPPELIELARFAVRHHDYIKDVFLGEAPVALVADDLASLPAPLRRSGLALLGMIQVAGAASLGEGRLTSFRLEIFGHCVDGSALADPSAGPRAARLLRDALETTAPPVPADLPRGGPVVDLVERVPLHGWHMATAGLDGDERRSRLEAVAETWAAVGGDHVSLAAPITSGVGKATTKVALNGTKILVLAS